MKRICFYIMTIMLLCTPTITYSQSHNPTYVVEQGDTAYSISKRYGITVEEIYELNPWAREGLRLGSKLLLPSVAKLQSYSPKAQTPQGRRYIIGAGDTMYSVCKRFGITEAQLIGANPDLSPEKFPAGRGIIIPPSDYKVPARKTSLEDDRESIPSPSENTDHPESTRYLVETQAPAPDAIRLTLVLPFAKDPKYIDFYRGMLMGINDEKRRGISIDLNVVDISDEDNLYKAEVEGSFHGRDIVIGGEGMDDITEISRAVDNGYYIVPFNASADVVNLSPRIIQINTSSALTQQRVAQYFVNHYATTPIYIASRAANTESELCRQVKEQLSDRGIAYQTINLDEVDMINTRPGAVILPVDKTKDLLEVILSKMSVEAHCSLFGYSLWQSFPEEITAKLHQYNTSIFSTFFLDNKNSEVTIFAAKYRAWYNAPIRNTFPSYSVMGYDIARYFISKYKSGAGDLLSNATSSQTLQMNFNLIKSNNGIGNKAIYIVNYTDDGQIIKQSIQ